MVSGTLILCFSVTGWLKMENIKNIRDTQTSMRISNIKILKKIYKMLLSITNNIININVAIKIIL